MVNNPSVIPSEAEDQREAGHCLLHIHAEVNEINEKLQQPMFCHCTLGRRVICVPHGSPLKCMGASQLRSGHNLPLAKLQKLALT
jgi:hypothetical protein